MGGIHRWPVNSPHKWPVTRKYFHLMTSPCPINFFIAVTVIFTGRPVRSARVTVCVYANTTLLGTTVRNVCRSITTGHGRRESTYPNHMAPPMSASVSSVYSRNTLQWRHNECDGDSDHQRFYCLLSRVLGKPCVKKRLELRVAGLCEGKPRGGAGGFLSQRASNAENVSIWWHHHEMCNRRLI